MQMLSQLLHDITVISSTGNTDIPVSGLAIDSRLVSEGSLFIAIRGTVADGHDFIGSVIEKGTTSIVCETLPAAMYEGVTYIQVADTKESLGHLSSAFYNHPSSKIKLVGVTGTNGKTTVATLLFQLFRNFGYRCGLLSTVQNCIQDEVIPATHTTPDAISLNALLARMTDAGCEYVFMECSSHAIHQRRIAALHFTAALFTNLTHDHLDYHKTFAAYRDAKKLFFDTLSDDAIAIINKDDKNGPVMIQNTKASCYTYSMSAVSDFKVRILEHDLNGMLLSLDGTEVWVQLTGEFNAYNLCLVYATAFLLGISKEELPAAISLLRPVTGRFDYLRSEQGITAIVDYAHTPDALKNVLTTIEKIRTRNEQLITVIGCGGDRDKAKRPVMASVACELSDKVIFTSDNPRTENPETILDEMEKGVRADQYKKTMRITDRRQAIKTAVQIARPGDILLIAGKGHETYQEVNGIKTHFDDKEEVLACFEMMKNNTH